MRFLTDRKLSDEGFPGIGSLIPGSLRTAGVVSVGTGSGGTQNIGAIGLAPIWFPRTVRVDQTGVWIATASTTGGGNCRTLMYRDTGDIVPGDLVFASEPLPTDVANVRPTDATVDVTLPAGLYWLGVHSNSGAALRNIPLTSLAALHAHESVDGIGWITRATKASVAFGAHPDPWDAVVAGTGNCQAAFVRLAAL